MFQTLEKPVVTSNLSEWLDFISQLHSSVIDLGLARVAEVAARGELDKPAPFVITVSGTNGKGSTCALIESILLDAGYKVGVYSSPHLVKYNERCRINGVDATDAMFMAAFSHVEALRDQTPLTFFEYGTLAAFSLFKASSLDVVVIEVGLGGRLDATNILSHDVSVITSIALDHVDWLGDDLDVIAFEKAGIFRANNPAICGQVRAPATIAAHADDIGAHLHQVGIQFSYKMTSETRWSWRSGPYELANLPVPKLPLANAATALMAIGASGLSVSDINVVNGLHRARLQGRMQIVSKTPLIILDVAHNPHSAEYLAAQLKEKYLSAERIKRCHFVVGMLKDKDVANTIAALVDVPALWYPASIEDLRGLTANELASFLPNVTACFSSPAEAYQAALSACHEDELLLVFGSFHTVGDVIERHFTD